MDDRDLEEQLELHDKRVKDHGAEDGERITRERRPTEADLIIARYRELIGEPFRPPRGLVASDHTRWFAKFHDGPRWQFAKTRLGLPEAAVHKASDTADQILARLADPASQDITTRGLVLGHVQSGKTTSFLSVAAKAADNGYDLVIILAGVHNSLRRQTQNRAAHTLVHNKGLWWLGTSVGDFKPDGNSLQSHLAGDGKRGLLVVKKHSKILESLADWLERESDAFLRRHAVLVIDDEADQAGLDVGTGAELEGVHKQLRRVVNLQTSDGKRRCAYLAYTATPYANILTAQDEFGLYPRDFIYPLDKPPGYVGSEEFFGDAQIGNPVLLETDESEDLLTAGLKDAVRWFVVATAARAALQGPVESFHSSMLIHTTQSTEEQKAYRPVIEEFLVDLRNEFELDESTMRDFYLKKLDLVPARQGGGDGHLNELTAPWGAVRLHVRAVLWRLIERVTSGEPFKEDGREQLAHSGVIVDNSKEEWKDRLTYSDIASGEPSVTVIAVGGNTLSRGLTLEGLVCSYFARTARTYDSLMQMGRWFGYRPGYRHLLRVWTTRELFNWFAELNQVEVELREELLWMQAKGMTPDRYGPRIRVSPNLNITRAAAMRSVCKEISYSDTLIDPAWLDLDADVIATNQQLARLLAGGLDGPAEDVGPSKLFRSVPHDRVRRFLAGFRFHAEEKRVDVDSLLRYLDNHEAKFPVWSVLFKSLARGGSDEFDYGGNVGIVSPVVRARQATASVAYIGSLVDSGDHRLDAGGAPPEGEARFRASPEPPLMVVYAIDRVSSPARKGRTDNGKLPRAPLNAPSSPISVSMALPKTSVPDYVMPAIRVVDNSRAELDLWDHDVV